jgi:hypothetical protein
MVFQLSAVLLARLSLVLFLVADVPEAKGSILSNADMNGSGVKLGKFPTLGAQ